MVVYLSIKFFDSLFLVWYFCFDLKVRGLSLSCNRLRKSRSSIMENDYCYLPRKDSDERPAPVLAAASVAQRDANAEYKGVIPKHSWQMGSQPYDREGNSAGDLRPKEIAITKVAEIAPSSKSKS